MDPALPEYCRARVLVLGCGNPLFGDDGFGPRVVAHLTASHTIPSDVCVIDVGLGARRILFTIALSERRPERLVVVDAVDVGRSPGEIFELDVSELPEKKIDDFSMHQLPTSNLLKELRDFCGMEIRIISAQVESIPDIVRPGLSATLEAAIPEAAKKVLQDCGG